MRVMSPDEKHEDDLTPALKHVEQSSTELATSTAVTDLGSKPPPPSDGGLLAEVGRALSPTGIYLMLDTAQVSLRCNNPSTTEIVDN